MATTDVLKVPGNYILDARNGNVTINVTNAPTTGTVTILGNLDVIGQTTQIESIDASIKDNIIILNSGEVNEYVTKGTSGILIARGHSDDPNYAATLLFNDNNNWTINGSSTRGIFEFKAGQDGVPQYSAIKVNAIRIDSANTGTLNLLGDDNANSILSVEGTTDYEVQVAAAGDDAIPNRKYVDDLVAAGSEQAKKIQVGFTSVKAFSPLEISGEFYYSADKIEGALGTSTNVVFRLEGNEAQLQGLVITDFTIQANTTTDIVLQPPVGQVVMVESPLKLETATAPSPDFGYSSIYYSGSEGGGGTGIHFVNNTITDELVSRRRAILYSIIF